MNSLKKIVILTEYGARIGFGHLTRSFAIAEALRKNAESVELWAAPDHPVESVQPEATRIVRWYDLTIPLAEELAQADAVLVDSYLIAPDQIKFFENQCRRIAFLDDFHRRSYGRGCVIDWTLGAEQSSYPQKNPAVTYLLGSKFCALRPQFRRFSPTEIFSAPRSVLISLGGSDVRGLTQPVAEHLVRDFPQLTLNLVIGSGIQSSGLKEKLKARNVSLHTSVDAGRMQELMAGADLAVCGGGQTLYELASQGVPPVVITLADNQQEDIERFVAAGFAASAGWWNDSMLWVTMNRLLHELCNPETRKHRALLGRTCVDGEGADRLVDALLNAWDPRL